MTVERKTPAAARASPISSGCWWPRCFVARFFLRTREGARGFSKRFLRRRGTAARHSTPLVSALHQGLSPSGVGPLRGQGAKVLERTAEQVLAQIEEPGPERGAVERGADAGGVGESLQRPDEDRELEVGLRDADRAGVHAGAVEDRLPLQQLGGAGGAVPGAALGVVGLELEQVAPERALQPGERSLDAIGRAAQRRLALARGRRLRFATRPALEQPAEREGARLAGAELPDQPPPGLLHGRVVLEHVGPPGLICRANAHARPPGLIIGWSTLNRV